MEFLSVNKIIDLHALSIQRFGGLHGIRDKHLLESACMYPPMLHTMAQEKDIHVLATAYAYHLIKIIRL